MATSARTKKSSTKKAPRPNLGQQLYQRETARRNPGVTKMALALPVRANPAKRRSGKSTAKPKESSKMARRKRMPRRNAKGQFVKGGGKGTSAPRRKVQRTRVRRTRVRDNKEGYFTYGYAKGASVASRMRRRKRKTAKGPAGSFKDLPEVFRKPKKRRKSRKNPARSYRRRRTTTRSPARRRRSPARRRRNAYRRVPARRRRRNPPMTLPRILKGTAAGLGGFVGGAALTGFIVQKLPPDLPKPVHTAIRWGLPLGLAALIGGVPGTKYKGARFARKLSQEVRTGLTLGLVASAFAAQIAPMIARILPETGGIREGFLTLTGASGMSAYVTEPLSAYVTEPIGMDRYLLDQSGMGAYQALSDPAEVYAGVAGGAPAYAGVAGLGQILSEVDDAPEVTLAELVSAEGINPASMHLDPSAVKVVRAAHEETQKLVQGGAGWALKASQVAPGAMLIAVKREAIGGDQHGAKPIAEMPDMLPISAAVGETGLPTGGLFADPVIPRV